LEYFLRLFASVSHEEGCHRSWSGTLLILTRKPGETIRLKDNITLTVLAVDGTAVRVGVLDPSLEATSPSGLDAEAEIKCEDWLEKLRRSQGC
jgi:hypothetical protein